MGRPPLAEWARGGAKFSIAMHDNEPASTRLRFGVFIADVQAGELTKQGKRITLQEQPFQLLLMLLQKPGEVVTREELRTKLWPQTIVDFDHGLNKAVSKIREALGDSSENPRFVETVARRGYRFLCDVAVVDEKRMEPSASGLTTTSASAILLAPPLVQGARNFVRRLLGLGFAVALATAASWALYHKIYSSPKTINSLAVLPLENLSGDASQDYLADGMTDELTTRLAQISALHVISRTSAMTYKYVHRPLPEIASALNVDAVVEGSVSRTGERVHLNAQLIDARSDRHIWAESYDENMRDALSLQSNVARAVAEQISVTMKPQEQATLWKTETLNPDAYQTYLKGRYFWNQRTRDGLQTAIDYFTRAVSIDPSYAEAYAGLADSYAVAGDWKYGVDSPQDAFVKATTAAAKALALDDTLGEAHASLAFALDLYAWDWQAAETEYKRAIKLNPNYATAHQWYSWHLTMMGRDNEGMVELKKALNLDPLSLIINADLADALCVAGRFDEAVEQSRKILQMDPNFAVGHYELGQALAQKHMYDEAIAELQRSIALSARSLLFAANLGSVYAVSGREEEAKKIIDDLQSQHDQDTSADAYIAMIYVGLGDHDAAMIWLNEAYEARFKASILLHPAFDPLRSDVRFQDLLQRIGLPTSKN
jgi:TolB-like protein/DNA-binding winged helix-turn-helix (wHTH) protein/Tfp pilus assembly protein PilF